MLHVGLEESHVSTDPYPLCKSATPRLLEMETKRLHCSMEEGFGFPKHPAAHPCDENSCRGGPRGARLAAVPTREAVVIMK